MKGRLHLRSREVKARSVTAGRPRRVATLLGFAVAGALIFTLIQAILLRDQPRAFHWTLVALACICATQVLFWTLTYPANRATANWTTLPAHWTALRARWEYSHAAAAGLNLIAHAALVISLLVRCP